mmetsp:Transcript_29773/g.64474  ORF Transcript_29773/g.64474 Transcript_29773/m.64474 type:complete len:236 (+) Transcript_29773:488-1195(+)
MSRSSSRRRFLTATPSSSSSSSAAVPPPAPPAPAPEPPRCSIRSSRSRSRLRSCLSLSLCWAATSSSVGPRPGAAAATAVDDEAEAEAAVAAEYGWGGPSISSSGTMLRPSIPDVVTSLVSPTPPTATPARSLLALPAKFLNSSSLRSLSSITNRFFTTALILTSSLACRSATYKLSLKVAKLVLMVVSSLSPLPSAAKRLSSGMVYPLVFFQLLIQAGMFHCSLSSFDSFSEGE